MDLEKKKDVKVIQTFIEGGVNLFNAGHPIFPIHSLVIKKMPLRVICCNRFIDYKCVMIQMVGKY